MTAPETGTPAPDPPADTPFVRLNRIRVLALLLAVMGYQLAIRVDNATLWLGYEERFVFGPEEDRRPLMLTVDAYYYLNVVKDLLAGEYDEVDEKRNVPMGYKRPHPPPLIALTVAGLSRVAGCQPEWIALFLPAVLGILLAIPVYLLGRELASPLVGLLAAFFALLLPAYVNRTSLGWFDTDILNVTLAATGAYLAHGFATGPTPRRRLTFLALAVVNALLYIWWWNFVPTPAALGIVLLPLVLGAAVFYRPPRREGLIVIGGGVVAALLFLVLKHDTLIQMLSTFKYITATIRSEFPETGTFVSEQAAVSLSELATTVLGGWPALVFALLALPFLVHRCGKKLVFLASFIGFAAFSHTAIRFCIFLAPLVGLALGCLLDAAAQWNRFSLARRRLLLPVLLFLMAWPPLRTVQQRGNWIPTRSPYHFDTMLYLAENTPADAVILANWGHGHPIRYYADRSVVADGHFHGGELIFYLSYPFAQNDDRLAANWMQFLATHNTPGFRKVIKKLDTGKDEAVAWLARVLAAGPAGAKPLLLESGYCTSEAELDTALPFFFPGEPPVYLFVDRTLVRMSWFNIGRWNLRERTGEKQRYMAFDTITFSPDGTKLAGISESTPHKQLIIDLEEGVAQLPDTRDIPLKEVVIEKNRKLYSRTYPRRLGFRFECMQEARYGVLMNEDAAQTLLNRLHMRLSADPRYFQAIRFNRPDYQIWRVRGEKAPSVE